MYVFNIYTIMCPICPQSTSIRTRKFCRVLVPILFGEFSHPTLQTCDAVMTIAVDILAESP